MTQAQQYTKAIAELPRNVRHIVAGAVASRVQGRSTDPAWKEIWKMSRDHATLFDWISGDELLQNLLLLDIDPELVYEMVDAYNSHGDGMRKREGVMHGPRRDGCEKLAAFIDDRYEWCDGEGTFEMDSSEVSAHYSSD